MYAQEPDDCQWVQTTASEGPTCPKLHRFAAWLDQQDPADRAKVAMESQKGYRRMSKAKGSKEVNDQNMTASPQLDQLTAVVGMLAKEVQSLKEEKESRRKINSSADGVSSSDWETMTNPQ